VVVENLNSHAIKIALAYNLTVMQSILFVKLSVPNGLKLTKLLLCFSVMRSQTYSGEVVESQYFLLKYAEYTYRSIFNVKLCLTLYMRSAITLIVLRIQ
jgi:hypothetical protein